MLSTKGLSYLLGISRDEIQEVAGNSSHYYQEFTKQTIKRNGKVKTRIIEPSTGELKRIQKRIKSKILERLIKESKGYTLLYGGIKGKCNIDNAKIHQGKKYHFCTDLRNFFPSITNNHVFNCFRSFGYSTKNASIMTKLTTTKGHLPQGAPTSSHLANLVFLKYDLKLWKLCEKLNIVYTRFIDDLTFSSQNDFKKVTFELLNVIEDSPYKINHRKTFYSDKPVEVTGIVVKQNNLDITDAFKTKDETLLEDSSKQSRKVYRKRIENA